MHGLHNAVRIFPNDIAELERLGQENIEGFLDTLQRHKIDAHQTWGGELTVAIGDHRVEDVKAEYELHHRYGHQVELLDKEQVQAQVNSPLYSGACWSKKQSGTVHPARLAWGLKAAALTLGVKLFEHTPMEELTEEGSGMRLRTHDGSIRTPQGAALHQCFCFGSCPYQTPGCLHP